MRMAEDEGHDLVIFLEDLLRAFQIGRFLIEIWRGAVARHEVKAIQRSLQIMENHRHWHTEQNKEDTVDTDNDLQDVVDDSQSAHQRIVEKDVVVEYAEDPQGFTHDRNDRRSGEKQEGQQYPAQCCAHLAVKVVRQNPVGDLHRTHRANILQPVAFAEVRTPTGASNERFSNEVSYRQSVTIAIVRKGIERVALLPVLDPDLFAGENRGSIPGRCPDECYTLGVCR